MSYSSMVMENVRQYSKLKIIDTQKIYKEKFNKFPELTFYKAISRMAEIGEIERISKGIYCIPKKGRFGNVISNEKNILEYFLGVKNNKGVVIGYQLFVKYGLTTQVAKVIEAYSSVITQKQRSVRNVLVRKAKLNFDITTIKLIELLEVLQEYKNIEDLNKMNFIKFIEKRIKYYDEKTVKRVINTISYKKSTLASLKNILKFYNVENTIDEYLSGTSKYNTINMEEFHEITPQKG